MKVYAIARQRNDEESYLAEINGFFANYWARKVLEENIVLAKKLAEDINYCFEINADCYCYVACSHLGWFAMVVDRVLPPQYRLSIINQKIMAKDADLAAIMAKPEYYFYDKTFSQIAQIRKELAETEVIMIQDIAKVIERNNKIAELEKRVSKVDKDAVKRYKIAKKQRWRHCPCTIM